MNLYRAIYRDIERNIERYIGMRSGAVRAPCRVPPAVAPGRAHTLVIVRAPGRALSRRAAEGAPREPRCGEVWGAQRRIAGVEQDGGVHL